ncbi:MAG: prepilin-type N-terminal cleavage/methylation domain-containing protein [bacterium]
MLRRKNSFTLIELLIVVAIIGILAAIAVPNFLNAQTRAKVARVRADLRSLGTALETYFLDRGDYPRDQTDDDTWYKYLVYPCLFPLTTPVAYLSDISMQDPFVGEMQRMAQVTHAGGHSGSYMYYHYHERLSGHYETSCPMAVRKAYCSLSMGPDYFQSGLFWLPVHKVCPGIGLEEPKAYAPSNGLYSVGDIVYFGGDIPVSGAVGG